MVKSYAAALAANYHSRFDLRQVYLLLTGVPKSVWSLCIQFSIVTLCHLFRYEREAAKVILWNVLDVLEDLVKGEQGCMA